jgi:hypothetical protein
MLMLFYYFWERILVGIFLLGFIFSYFLWIIGHNKF